MSALHLVLLALLGLSGGAREDPPAPEAPPAQLVVRAGRAELVQKESIATLTRASGARAVAGPAYVELAPGGEVDLAWSGSASLRVRGPAALEWGPGPDVRVLRAARVEVEVRRGARTVHLSGGWSFALERAAVAVAERASGDLVLEHRGGADLAILRDGARTASLASGRSVVLEPRRVGR